jgi:sugar lactone lactonase YvrE
MVQGQRFRRKVAVVMFACVVLLATAVPVMADPSDPQPSAAGAPSGRAPVPGNPITEEAASHVGAPPQGPSSAQIATLLEKGKEEERLRQEQLESPAAVAEREASAHAYSELDASEAEELLVAKFPRQLEGLNSDSARSLTERHLDQPLGEGDAVVSDEGKKELLEGELPVEAKNEEGELEKVDVDLERTPEGLKPENPIVEVLIPDSPEEGIQIGEPGEAPVQAPITVTQLGAEETHVQAFGEMNAFYSEVEPGSDMDLLVAPTERGVEMFDLLRSADSPRTIRFQVEVPRGDELTAQGSGAAVVAGDGTELYTIPTPRATDAQGSLVPMSLAVEGDTVVLHLEDAETEVAYPILVDPAVENNWDYYGNIPGIPPWEPYLSSAGNGFGIGTSDSQWPGTWGLFFSAAPGWFANPSWSELVFKAPNDWTYIDEAAINIFWRGDACSPLVTNPYDFDGMFVYAEAGVPVAEHWNGEHINDAYNYGNSYLPYWGNEVVVGFGAAGGDNSCWRNLIDGGMHIYEEDWAAPTMNAASSSAGSGWVTGSTQFAINVNATDLGLGVKEFAFTPSETNPGNPENRALSCVGTWASQCPTHYEGAFSFAGTEFPKGEDNLSVGFRNPTDRRATPIPVTVKVDTEPPVVQLNGQLQAAIQQAGAGEKQGEGGPELTQPVYNLEVEATDGVEGTSNPKLKQSGVRTIEVSVTDATGKVVESTKAFPNPKAPCSQGSCEEKITYPIPMTGLPAGKHRLQVKAYDFAGNKPAELEREFEYFPATGLTEEDVTQRFLLPDGKEHEEGPYQGPELAVNVMNGNVVYHQRDVDVEGPTANLEAELFYNSQLPKEESSEFGRGWTLSQTPSLEKAASGNMATALTSESQLTGNVALPQEVGEGHFSDKLGAYIEKEPGGGYSVSEEGGEEAPATVYDSKGLATEVQTSPTTSVEYAYAGEHLSEIAVNDPGATDRPPPPVKRAPSIVPNYVSSFGSFGTGNGQFSHPADVALDAKGDAWVVDSGNNRIEEFTPGGEFVKSLGSAGTGNGQFTTPMSLAFDASGDLWVVDSGDSRLEEFGPTGTFIRAVGSNGSGNAQFNRPEGIAIAPSGHIWVADTMNHRIVELNAAGEFIKVVNPSGLGAVEPTGIDVGPEGDVWIADEAHNRVVEFGSAGELIRQVGSEGTGEAQFKHPDAIAVGALGEVWVGDQKNERIQELTKEGAFVTQFGAPGSGAGQFSLSSPMGIATDNEGSLLVTDTNNNRVEHWQIPHYGYKPVYAASFGSTGTAEGQFRHPSGLALDDQGHLWVPDVENNRVQELNKEGKVIRCLGCTGPSPFKSPKSIAFAPEGEFWVADAGDSRLEEFTEGGELIRSVGKEGTGNGQFHGPEGVAVAPNGHIWVADTYNYRIVELDEDGNFIKVVNPPGLGQIEPTSIAFGPGGNAWITDWAGNRVVEINPAGEMVRQVGSAGSGNGQFSHPDAVAIDSRGIVYVVDQSNARVQVFNQAGEYLSQFGSAGSGAGQLAFGYPTGIAADSRGNLWVADSDNNRIERWQTGSWVPAEEEEIPAHDDPSVAVSTSAGLITSVVGAEAGSHHYTHSGELLTSDEGPEGTTHYEYEATQMLKKITLPNGTTAAIKYESAGRASEVIVDPAGAAGPKWTKFSYVQEIGKTVAENHNVAPGSREVIVEPEAEARTFYAIDGAGDVVKSWNVEVAPIIFSESGTLTQVSKEEPIKIEDTQELFIKAFAPEGVRKIQFIVNGSIIVDEKTCTGSAAECEYETLQWIVEPEDLPTGTMWIEVVITSRVEEKGQPRKSSARWWVTVPYIPPSEPGIPQPPKYKRVLEFREENGLDIDLNPVADELALHARVWETIDAWWNPSTPAGEVANATWERWGVPLRYVDEQELEYREAYLAQDAPLIQAWAEEHASNVYGGYYMDERAGGLLRLGFTEDQTELIAQMKAELGGQLMAPEMIVGFSTPPTTAARQIEARAESIEEDWEPGAAIGENVVGVSFDPAINKVRIEAENLSAAAAEVSSATGSLAQVQFVQVPEQPQFLSARYRTSGPIRAGDSIATIKRGCTAAFGASEQAPPGKPTRKFVLTAGHCFETGSQVGRLNKPGGELYLFGEVVRDALPARDGRSPVKGETDGEAIKTDSESLAPTEIDFSKPITAAAPEKEFLAEIDENERLCFSGVVDGLQCGKSAGAAFVRLHEGSFRSGKMNEIRVPGVEIEHGDSGAPVWNAHTGRPVGVVSGGFLGRHGTMFVAPLRPLPTEMGVSQPGVLEALSQSLGPLWLNVP